MKWRSIIMIMLLSGLVLPLVPSVNGAGKVGIVKGTVTIQGRPAADAVISVEGLPPQAFGRQPSDLGSEKAAMDQREMKFFPRVLPVLAGTTVSFPNNDTTWHNVYSKSEAKEFDLGLYPRGESRSVTFDKPGMVRILCNVHPQMEAFIVVMEHPYFSPLDKRGNYRLDQVPLGQYNLQVWHPEFETKRIEFSIVRGGEVLIVNIDLR